MARKKKSSKLGFDPLAWMKGGPETAHAEEKPAANEPEAVAPTPVVEKTPTPEITPTLTASAETVVFCGEALGIDNVSDLKQRLSAALQSDGTVVLDAAGINLAQTPGLQLFVTFVRAAEQKGLQIEWRNPTETLKESARLLGLAEALKLAA